MSKDILAQLAVTIAVAMVGGYGAQKMHVPSGALIGSMLAVATLNVVCKMAYVPSGWKFYTQISTGAYIGAKISRDDLQKLNSILKPAAILALIMLVVTMAAGILICSICDLTPSTVLFAIAPAGVTDMTLASMDFDSEPSVVALVQTIRIVFTVSILPLVFRMVDRRDSTNTDLASEYVAAPVLESPDISEKKSTDAIVTTLIVALICGRIGMLLGIPAGALTCSVAGTVVFNLFTNHAFLPIQIRRFIQVFAGALIGCTIKHEQVQLMLRIWPVILIAIIGYILLDIIAAWIIHQCTEMDIVTALFASAPGGLTDMALIAEDMGADSVKVAGMQMLRMLSVVITYPSIIGAFVQYFY